MQNNKTLILFILLFTAGLQSFSQVEEVMTPKERSRQYALILYLGGGFGYFPTNKGAPAFLQPQLKRFNPVTTARVMWKPDHRLKAGLEAGYMTFYSYNLTGTDGNKGKVSLDAIPILLEFSVSVKKHFNLFAGPGIYLLRTNLNYEGKTASKKVSTGWMAAFAYTTPLSKDLSLGTEAKWLYTAETVRGSFGVQLQLMWKFLKW